LHTLTLLFFQTLTELSVSYIANSKNPVPGLINLSFPGFVAEALLMNLDLAGVAASTGAACSSGSFQASSVLQAMDLSDDRIKSAVRFSFGWDNTPDDVVYIAQSISEICHRLEVKTE